MTALVEIVGAVLIGAVVGVLAFSLRYDAAYQRGVLAGQRQEQQAHSDWHPVLSAEAWNRLEVPARHRRSPDHKGPKPAPAQPIRPVFYDR